MRSKNLTLYFNWLLSATLSAKNLFIARLVNNFFRS